MKLYTFAFVITDDCNFDCDYCQQKKEKTYMKRSTIDKAAAFFLPYSRDDVIVQFYGGEPLLAMDEIKYTVRRFGELNTENKGIRYNLTTNGSLMTDKMLEFFNAHKFSVMLSYDGLAQEDARHPGTLMSTGELMRRVKDYPDIEFSTNSVFSPETVGRMTESLRHIAESGGMDIKMGLTRNIPWSEAQLETLDTEYEKLTAFLLDFYKAHGRVAVSEFRPPEQPKEGGEPRRFYCDGAVTRMSVAPDEQVWGCFLFHEHLKDKKDSDDFKTYSFGTLDDFIADFETRYPEIRANYEVLSQDSFYTEHQNCFLCGEVDSCKVCPVNAAHITSFIGKVPPYVCRLHKLLKAHRERFYKALESTG